MDPKTKKSKNCSPTIDGYKTFTRFEIIGAKRTVRLVITLTLMSLLSTIMHVHTMSLMYYPTVNNHNELIYFTFTL